MDVEHGDLVAFADRGDRHRTPGFDRERRDHVRIRGHPFFAAVHGHVLVEIAEQQPADLEGAVVETSHGLHRRFDSHGTLCEDCPAGLAARRLDHRISAGRLGFAHRLAEVERVGDGSDCRVLLDPRRLHGVARGGDEPADAHRDVAQHVGGRDDRAQGHQAELAVQFAVAAGDGLDRLVARAVRQSHPAELAGRVRPHVTCGVEHLDAEHGRLDPAVQRGGRAVLRRQHRGDRSWRVVHQQLQRVDVVARLDLPVGSAGCADRRDRRDQCIIRNLVDRAEHRRAEPSRHLGHDLAVGHPTAAAARQDRAAPDGVERVVVRQLADHLSVPIGCELRSPSPARPAASPASA